MKLAMFVHGLGGKAGATWGKFPELVSSDAGLDWKVGFYEYPTLLVRLPFWKPTPKIQLLSDGLKTTLDHSCSSADEIALICHSLGGLIAKKYILDSLDAQQALRVTRLVLFGVPGDGAALAAIASLISWRNYPLRQLCRNSDFLDALNRDWRRLQPEQRLAIRTVVGGSDQVVTSGSASHLAAANTVDVVIDKDHRSLVKPTSHEELSYKIVRQVLVVNDRGPEVPVIAPMALGRQVPSASKPSHAVHSAETSSVWQLSSQSNGSTIVVVGPETQRTRRPEQRDPDFAYLDEFGDIDSIFEASTFLGRLFPSIETLKFPAPRLSGELLRQPLVVIGGPLGEQDRGGNKITQAINKRSAREVLYDLDRQPPSVRIGNITLSSTLEANGLLVKDIGIVIRCPNPWNPTRRLLVFQGIHSAGVLGGLRALCQGPTGQENCELIVRHFGADPLFVAAFEVVLERGVLVPASFDSSCAWKWIERG